MWFTPDEKYFLTQLLAFSHRLLYVWWIQKPCEKKELKSKFTLMQNFLISMHNFFIIYIFYEVYVFQYCFQYSFLNLQLTNKLLLFCHASNHFGCRIPILPNSSFSLVTIQDLAKLNKYVGNYLTSSAASLRMKTITFPNTSLLRSLANSLYS